VSNIDEALRYVNKYSTGTLAAKGLVRVSGTDAVVLRENLEGIRATGIFTKIQELKDSGGGNTGLGQIAIPEFNALGASQAVLTQELPPAVMKRNLEFYKARLQLSAEMMEAIADGKGDDDETIARFVEKRKALYARYGEGAESPTVDNLGQVLNRFKK
jgi:hypothetical protein